MMEFINKNIINSVKNNSSQIIDQALNIFGSNVTHVCNAYSGRSFFWLYFHPERLRIDDLNEAQCLKLPYGEYKRHKRNLVQEYMTGIVENGGRLEALFYNYKIELNRSYIVTHEGYLKQSNYETSEIWHDYSGRNYLPSEEEIEAVKAADLGLFDHRLEMPNGIYIVNMKNVNITNSIVVINSRYNQRDFIVNER